jgi:hypothetical protein
MMFTQQSVMESFERVGESADVTGKPALELPEGA